MRLSSRKQLIGQMLLDKGLIKVNDLENALDIQKTDNDYLCSTLIKQGLVKTDDVYQVLSQQIGIDYVDLKNHQISDELLDKVPVKIALHYSLVPYSFQNNILKVALADPLDIAKLDDLAVLFDTKVEAVLAYEEDILETIKKAYGVGADILDEMMASDESKAHQDSSRDAVADLEEAAEEASIAQFVNRLFIQAVDERATDIHLEPYEDKLRIRFRIDGFLYEMPVPDSVAFFHKSIVSRIKIISGLDIAEHRVPQDGRIRLKIKDSEIDFRVSVLPSAFGESVQIRILGSHQFISLDQLGLSDEDKAKIDILLDKSHGIIFVTGPTGSGKSTLLYAALQKKNKKDIKIITTEDPIENQMQGITQVQINPKAGLTFAESLRSILRHDPDVIMVGEVRDGETAEITIRSAMTGHLVFSTIHTNDAASTPMRLIDMGIEPFLVASSLEGLIAQRLVRTLCPKCMMKSKVNSQLFIDNNIECDNDSVEIFEPCGCDECRHTGYKGRTALFEILLIDTEIRDLIFKRCTSQVIKDLAVKNGMQTLRQDGLKKVLRGITTVEEVLRVS